MSPDSVFVYWDASAVLSALIQDEHGDQAHKWSKRKGIHFISTLCRAEVYAVLFRVDRLWAPSGICGGQIYGIWQRQLSSRVRFLN